MQMRDIGGILVPDACLSCLFFDSCGGAREEEEYQCRHAPENTPDEIRELEYDFDAVRRESSTARAETDAEALLKQAVLAKRRGDVRAHRELMAQAMALA